MYKSAFFDYKIPRLVYILYINDPKPVFVYDFNFGAVHRDVALLLALTELSKTGVT